MKINKLAFVFISTLLILAFSRCGKNNGGGEATVNLSASLNSTDYTVTGISIFDKIFESLFVKSVFAVGSTVDQVWAIPLYNGEFHPSVFAYAKTAAITSSGFSMDLEKRNWVLILINSTAATPAAKVVGYVAMTVGAYGLQNIPLESAGGNLNLGELTSSGTETRSSRTGEDNSATVALSTENLLAMAKADDSLKVIKNAYRNYSNGTYYSIKPFYAWSTTSIGTTINNAYSNPASTFTSGNFKGYLFYMNSNNLTGINFSRICGGTDVMTLVPPSNVTNNLGSYTFTTSDPLASNYGTGSGQSGTSCGVGKNLYIRDDSSSYGSVQFNFSANASGDSNNGYLAPPIPSGDWSLKVNGTTMASFEGDLGSPFEGGDTTKPLVMVPAVRANVSGSTITSVSVKWYQRAIGSTTYTEVTDTTLLSQISSINISLTNYGTSPRQEEMASSLTPSTGYTLTPSTYTFTTSTNVAIAVSYVMYGVSYYLDWRY